MPRMAKMDLRKRFAVLYSPSREPSVVDVPALQFLMVDGEGDPNGPAFGAAVEALYAASYTLKFLVKGRGGPDHAVMPLEALWWADDPRRFRAGEKSKWKWTVMIAQPEVVTPELLEESRQSVREKKGLATVDALRLGRFDEGHAAQLLYTGPYSGETAAIEAVHAFIAAHGGRLTGKHHEIYLSDPRRTAPEKLRTIIRQPFRDS